MTFWLFEKSAKECMKKHLLMMGATAPASFCSRGAWLSRESDRDRYSSYLQGEVNLFRVLLGIPLPLFMFVCFYNGLDPPSSLWTMPLPLIVTQIWQTYFVSCWDFPSNRSPILKCVGSILA